MAIKGIILYDIEPDGCLNGVYTNNAADGVIFNEIARRNSYTAEENDGIRGVYDCFYFNQDPRRNNVRLTIGLAQDTSTGRAFSFEWEGQRIRFSGIGYRMNERQLVVHYWD
jgi:hypothetical protein